MMQLGGYWWPEWDRRGSAIISRDAAGDIEWVLSHVKGRDCIIQAGANVGVYPIGLADHFKKVLTVEPDDQNFLCLTANIQARDSLHRVDARKAAFGEEAGTCKVIQVEPDNSGAHRVGLSDQGTVVLPIDSFNLDPDVIWLDVEGFELQAIKGALKTIERCRPVIVLELKQLGRIYGYDDQEVYDFLENIGYSCVERHLNDRLFKCSMV
jgi:FkbM family methyltransferase